MLRSPRWTALMIVAALGIAPASGRLQAATKAATYGENQCRPAPQGWQRRGSEFGELMTVNLLEIRHDRLVWNGAPVNRRTLQTYLAESRRLNPAPNIVLVIDQRSTCSEVASVRASISGGLRCGSDHACVEYTAAAWRKAQPPAKGGNVR
jgi:hypothetical protein